MNVSSLPRMRGRAKAGAAAVVEPVAAALAAAPSTSDRLKDAAIQLFARHGLEAVSVRDIAAGRT